MNESEPHHLLHAFLADRDVPCPHCGYNLRGLQAGVCPECKHDLRLKLDGDFAAMRYLPLLYWLIGCMMLSATFTMVMMALNLINFSGGLSMMQTVSFYGLPIASAMFEIAACVFVWIRVRKARRTGVHVIRAYVVCVAAVLLVSVLHLGQWLVQLIINWAFW